MQEHLHYTIKLELTVDTLQSLQNVYDYLDDKLLHTPIEEQLLYDIIIQSKHVQDVVFNSGEVEPEPEATRDNNDVLGLRCVEWLKSQKENKIKSEEEE